MNLLNKISDVGIGLAISAVVLTAAACVSKLILENNDIYIFPRTSKVMTSDVNGNGADKSERYVIINEERFYSMIDGKGVEGYMEKQVEKEKER